MKKSVKWIIGIVILSAAVLLVALKLIDESNKVEFVDETTGSYIVSTGLSKKETHKKKLGYDDFRKDDLKYVTRLEIGTQLRKCETLVDLEKCWNLESLTIFDRYDVFVRRYGEDVAAEEYKRDYGELPPPPLSDEKIRQFGTELEGILQECGQLKTLCIYNRGGTFNLDSVQFLHYGGNLTYLDLDSLGDIDYSPVCECTNLEALALSYCAISDLGEISRLENLRFLYLGYTGIKEAGDIVTLKHLEKLYIPGTPLAENEEELQILREALPELEIITEDPWN